MRDIPYFTAYHRGFWPVYGFLNMTECDEVRNRYDRRSRRDWNDIYSPLWPHSYLAMQEKECAMIRWIRSCGIAPTEAKRVLEVGCGSGDNLLEFIRLGFQAENLVGNELLEDRAKAARSRLPSATRIIIGDASEIDRSEGLFDIVLQSTVFTSILDDDFQQKLANKMWVVTKPGGGVLWYDFVYNNPWNPDVRGVPVRRIRELFPQGVISKWRLTLAPPISRRVVRVHPLLYPVLNVLPFLRTHVLCWIQKSN
jgi:SAM-dependent methyltransferase